MPNKCLNMPNKNFEGAAIKKEKWSIDAPQQCMLIASLTKCSDTSTL